ncbi:hypothetical protein [Portibacter lacus]|uniref:hypothetical protein n=1 Tax=Portibacter lacus TaxID=1099794 RepID=UPI001F256385|nr:hypothetical protein [Portibacter lacus]
MTQEEVLDAKMELVEINLQQLQAKVDIYRSLGGGWRQSKVMLLVGRTFRNMKPYLNEIDKSY